MTKKYWKPLASVVIWGASFIATKFLLDSLRPLTIIFVRQLLAVILLSIIAMKRGRTFKINFHDHSWIFILALIASFHLWIQVTGMQYTTASNTGWIIGITPVFMALLGMIFFKERLTAGQWSGILIAFSGLILLISKGKITSISLIENRGDFLILASAFTWSVYSLVGKKITLNYPPLMTILYLFLFMSLILAPFTLNGENVNSLIVLSAESIAALLFLGFFCSGIAYVLWAEAMNEMPSSHVGAFLYLEPFVTVFTAWILLSERISLLTLISGVIIIIGVIIVNRK
ncbi:DMT family transporter [Melioribacter sp. OK-6-Me]|uniref:DMT family transporter n=1 Tax=unclassified Melioribacter TaxID=2627329 RepID=UPI003EDAA827